MSMLSINDKMVEITPRRYQNLCLYHDNIKDEKDLKVAKEALIRV